MGHTPHTSHRLLYRGTPFIHILPFINQVDIFRLTMVFHYQTIIQSHIMNPNNFQKIFCTLAFFAFAGVSCWATAESLHLLLPTWPLVLCWIVTVGLFFIASYGSKMIVDSLNQKIYMEKRGIHLICGVIILAIFWLICSMPTNTHTFFYRNVIDNVVSSDINTTQNYLAQIKDNVVTEDAIKAACSKLRNDVELKLTEHNEEIKNEANPGDSKKAEEIRGKLAVLLKVSKIERLSSKGNSIQDREKLCNAYRSKILKLLEDRINILIIEMTPTSNTHIEQSTIAYKNLDIIQKNIDNEILDVNNADDIKTVCDKLHDGYSVISNYKQFVIFNRTDEEAYTTPNAVTKVKQVLSVYDVWMDFLQGKYNGHGFVFWIIISILVDIAAFIFFDIAFKKEQ